ncbi:MAG: hypothetical protein K5881_10995 [Saccharofermentans sp.]|nr:hypothetical protein [Saccharofermentans sp.]
MSSFSDNDENRRADSGNPDFEFAGLENNAPESGKEKASGSGVSDFEYGDDSVAGEYDVRESDFFKYGSRTASSDESIGAYYGHETRTDRYSKEDECECYGYETIPEVDYTEATAASASEESAAVSEPEAEPAAESGEPAYEETEYGQTAESIFGEREESQADESDRTAPPSGGSGYEPEYEDGDQAYEPDTEENYNESIADYDEPDVVTSDISYQDEAEPEAIRTPSHAKAATILSIAVSAIALTGILGICAFAIYFDSRKTDPTLIAAYPASTTRTAATTTTEETTTEAEATATPTPTPTNTPSPTPTPEPTNTPVPKKTQVQASVAKKPQATATPIPTVTTEPASGESGSGSGEGSGSSEGSGESSSSGGTDVGSGSSGGSTGGESGGSTEPGSGGTGGSTGGSTGSGTSGSTGGESGGTSTPPTDSNPESNP